MKHANATPVGTTCISWLKRAGLMGTVFFFAKGLLWIIVPAVLAWFGSGGG
jgi:hypothetical protein